MTLKDYITNIIGVYTPDMTASDLGQVDWVWIASAILLIVLVCGFFKALRLLIGGLAK